MSTDIEKAGVAGTPEGATVGVVPILDPTPTGPLEQDEAKEDPIVIDWEDGDPVNPFNWPQRKKLTVVIVACLIPMLTAANATSMAVMAIWGPAFYGTTRTMFIVGLMLYNVSVSVTALALAPVSENFGRNQLYQITSIINALFFIPQALTRNIHAYLACRWFQGMVASVGISMVGGTIADVYYANERGQIMNMFTLIIFVGQALGGLLGWVGQAWGYQWCYGVQAFAATASCIINALLLRETRGDVLLERRARKLTKETGRVHITKYEVGHVQEAFFARLRVTLFRPLKFLITEPIVMAVALWIGFAWAILFLSGTAIVLVFRQYDFSPGQLGSVSVTIFLGGFVGYLTNFHQETLYRRAAKKSPTGRAPPEARLYWAACGGLLFPAGMLGFAWTGKPHIHWVVPAMFLVFAYTGMYVIYLGTFNYITDAYEKFSSSAQAAQGLSRNFCSGVFPLFAQQMYFRMGYSQASTLCACLGFVVGAAPFLLIIFGAKLRAKSPITSQLVGNL